MNSIKQTESTGHATQRLHAFIRIGVVASLATVGALAGTVLALQPRPKPAAVTQAIRRPAPQAAPTMTMTPLAMLQQGILPAMLPIVPEPKSFGRVFVNGVPAFECGWGASGAAQMAVTINGVSCTKARMWRTEAPMGQMIEVHRDLLVNGVDFPKNPNYPPVIVIWWCVRLDSRWQTQVLNGTDYNCSGGNFTVTL